ncbi:MAG: type II toxin-antitoxin system VapC family toxin [Rhizomicrobium sp.]
MKLLLDSHILLWWAAGDPKLGKRAEKLLATAGNDLFISAASWWELAVKQVLGRLRLDLAQTWRVLDQRGVRAIPVTLEHAQEAGMLSAYHSDRSHACRPGIVRGSHPSHPRQEAQAIRFPRSLLRAVASGGGVRRTNLPNCRAAETMRRE